jgi:hypothetical protein
MVAEKVRLFIIMICLPSMVGVLGKIPPARSQRRRDHCRDVDVVLSFTAFSSRRCNPVAQTDDDAERIDRVACGLQEEETYDWPCSDNRSSSALGQQLEAP